MKTSEGYIKLFRKFENWEWYTKPNTKAVFLHCLLNANSEDKQWQGIVIKRGQFVTSLENIAVSNGLTIQQTRTALNNILKTNEINKQTTSRYTIITVKNYDMYQGSNKQITQASNKQTTSKATDKQQQLRNKRDIIYLRKLSLSIEEREILKNYLLSKPRKEPIFDMDAYIALMEKNGTLKSKLEQALKWNEKRIRKKEEVQKQKEGVKEEVKEEYITAEEAGFSLKDIRKKKKGN